MSCMISQYGTGKKVYVGLSGGVDSAVSAVILKNEGYDVHGVFIKVWQPDWISCTWKEERRMAMSVAAHLDIPFTTLDLIKEYKHDVIDYMIREYREGRTPNPDIMCNRYVKFGGFWKWAKDNDADYIATGHYAQNLMNQSEGTIKKFKLMAGKDASKDQSYFLWTLNQVDLQHILFPVGSLLKSDVRKLANKHKLPNAHKKDSQGLCFIGKIDIKNFLSHYIDAVPGMVLNESGMVIGKHPGALFFTIGERHGFNITMKSSNDLPFYVVDKDMEKNIIIVSNKDLLKEGDKTNCSVTLTNVNWITGTPPSKSKTLQARTRYRQPLQYVKKITMLENEAVIEFDKPQDAVSKGQSLVIYAEDECLGGGIIK